MTEQRASLRGKTDAERLMDERIAREKEHLLARIEELRRTVDYDYPPTVFRSNLRDVQRAVRAYHDGWDERAREQRAQYRAVTRGA